MPAPRVFVSHSHQDDVFTARLVADLRAAGADVWVDMANINHGDFMQRIGEALARCEWVMLVLTPAAIASTYVQMEVNAALLRARQGLIRDVIPILAAPCPADSIPPLWAALHRYNAVADYLQALAGLLRPIGLEPASPGASDTPTAASIRDQGVYAPLTAYLSALPQHVTTKRLRFREIEMIIGRPLPPFAAERSFWANVTGSRSQSRAWLSAGWEVSYVDLPAKTVLFSRKAAK